MGQADRPIWGVPYIVTLATNYVLNLLGGALYDEISKKDTNSQWGKDRDKINGMMHGMKEFLGQFLIILRIKKYV